MSWQSPCDGAACTSSIELTCSRTLGECQLHMGMHMQTTLFMRTQQFDSSLAFLGLHTGYMGMGHGHAPGPALLIIRAVGVYAYDAGGVPLRSTTCVGAACTSSIELTCSRTCGRMAIACTCAHNTATTYSLLHAHAHAHALTIRHSLLHAHAHMRKQYDFSYYGIPQFASNHLEA